MSKLTATLRIMGDFTAFALFISAATILPSTVLANTADISDNQSYFTDVYPDETYEKGIEFLAEEEILDGYPDGTFRPNSTINRAEMMKIIAEGQATYEGFSSSVFDQYSDDQCFDDVPANEWYTKYVCYGKDQGWIVGYDNGKNFRPDRNVSFVEALKITMEGFGDTFYLETPDIWYRGVVERAAEYNKIPMTIKSFDADLKRNEMADLIVRRINSNSNSLEEYLGERSEVRVTYDSIQNGIDATIILEKADKHMLTGNYLNMELYNIETGASYPVAPQGYEILGDYDYQNLEDKHIVLLRKDDSKVFVYNPISGVMNAIDLSITDDELTRANYSLTEPHKIFIEIYKLTPESIDGFPDPISGRYYYYDASTGELETTEFPALIKDVGLESEVDNIFYGGCHQYKSSKFYYNSCGEGIGNTLPLSYRNLGNTGSVELISYDDFDIDWDYVREKSLESPVQLQTFNSDIYAYPIGGGSELPVDKIIIHDTETGKTINFIMNQQVIDHYSDSYFSMGTVLDISSKDILVLANYQELALLEYDRSSRTVTNATFIDLSSKIRDESISYFYEEPYSNLLWFETMDSQIMTLDLEEKTLSEY